MKIPSMVRVRQTFENIAVDDIEAEVASQIDALALAEKVSPGQTVAIGCTSRGLPNYPQIVRTVVKKLKELGLEPFLVPAMGSHGSASGPGQKRVLENYGLDEDAVGAPIKSSLSVDYIGETPEGVPVCIDRNANEADYIVLINCINQHGEFVADIESGLMKMMVIGLGKEEGANLYHKAFMTHGHYKMITGVARQVMQTGKFLFGVGSVVNGFGKIAHIFVPDADHIEEQEKAALRMLKRLAPKLPFEDVDVLIIDEMGKDIAGTGFDSKVVGRILMPLVTDDPATPRVKRILVCDLTEKTEGNADGIGIADFTTQRLVDKLDLQALYANALAGSEPEHARIPMALPNDKEAIEAAIDSVGLVSDEDIKVVRIKNTNEMEYVELSTAYLDAISNNPNLEIVEQKKIIVLDGNGNLGPF